MTDRIAQNKDAYNAIAAHFSDSRSFLWDDLKDPVFTQYLRSGASVLDIGCGNGRLSQLFVDHNVVYVGLDQSQALIDLARQKFPEYTFVVSEMTNLPFPDTHFDAVYAIASFHHLPDENFRLLALREMHRVLQGDGMVLMTNWNLSSDWAKEKYGAGEEGNFSIPWKDGAGNVLGNRYYHGFTLSELETLATEAGFSVKEQYYVKKGQKTDQKNGENIVTRLVRNS